MQFNSFSKGDPHQPSVICVHGLMGSARNLYRLVQSIADAGFYVTAYDQRGHGHSDHGGPYTLDQLADDLITVMDTQKIERAHLVGHSLGARVCLRAAALNPDRVLSLTILDAGTRPSDEGRDDVRGIVFSIADSYESKAQAEAAMAQFPERTKQFLMTNLRDRDGRLAFVFDLAGIKSGLFESLKLDQANLWAMVSCPALVVRGDRSEYLTSNELERMQKLNPKAQTAVISNAGHWLHVDNFSDTSQAIIAFLNSARS
jgi:esterase